MFPTKPSKYYFQTRLMKYLEGEVGTGKSIRILEIGSGTSEVAHNLLQAFQNIVYVGIEPDQASVLRARERLKGCSRATVIQGFGYGEETHQSLEGAFDIVFSLSVLEHVKQLSRFIDFSVEKARPGGEVIHLYDLGHSLHPSSVKEWVQTRLCATKLLRYFPEHKVARYLATPDVERALQRECDIQEITFSNMPNHIDLLKSHMTEDLMREVVEFETASFTKVSDVKIREKLFPTVCFWAKKKII